MRTQANIKGFRPGKVPPTYLKKVYGKSAMAEVMQDAINATVGDALTERSERAASAAQGRPAGRPGHASTRCSTANPTSLSTSATKCCRRSS